MGSYRGGILFEGGDIHCYKWGGFRPGDYVRGGGGGDVRMPFWPGH